MRTAIKRMAITKPERDFTSGFSTYVRKEVIANVTSVVTSQTLMMMETAARAPRLTTLIT